jgi:hypothetical protein
MALVAWILLSTSAGCNALNSIGPEICRRPQDDEPIVFKGGSVVNGVYMSSEWGYDEPLLRFPGGEYYEIHHGLGQIPRSIDFWVSFSARPFDAAEDDDSRGNSIAPAAGNQAEIKDVTEETLTVLNGSCVDYYLMVVASPGDIDGDTVGIGAGGMSGTGGGSTGGSGGMGTGGLGGAGGAGGQGGG